LTLVSPLLLASVALAACSSSAPASGPVPATPSAGRPAGCRRPHPRLETRGV